MLNFILAIRYFLLYTSLLLFFYYYYIANFFSNFHILIKNIFFYHKHTYVQFHQNIFAHFWEEYTWRSNCFIIFVANEICKILFTKRKLIRYYYFIKISFLFWWNLCFLISVPSNFIFSLSIFIYSINFFYNFFNS